MDEKSCLQLAEFTAAASIVNQLQQYGHGLVLGSNEAYSQLIALKARTSGAVFFVFQDYTELKAYYDMMGEIEDVYIFLPMELEALYSLTSTAQREHARAEVMQRLQEGEHILVLTTLEALCQRLYTQCGAARTVLRAGQIYERQALCELLVRYGYVCADAAESAGEYSVRGEIIDICDKEDSGVRIVFLYDTIESIRRYDPATQLSTKSIQSVTLGAMQEAVADEEKIEALSREIKARIARQIERTPANTCRQELLKTQARLLEQAAQGTLPSVFVHALLGGDTCILDFAPQKQVFFWGIQNLKKNVQALPAAQEALSEVLVQQGLTFFDMHDVYLSFFECSKKLAELSTLGFQAFDLGAYDLAVEFRVQTDCADVHGVRKSVVHAVESVRDWLGEKYCVVVGYCDAQQKALLSTLFSDYNMPFDFAYTNKQGLHLVQLPLLDGFVLPSMKMAVAAAAQFASSQKKGRARKRTSTFKTEFLPFTKGDYVAVEEYGIGRFMGMEKIVFSKTTTEMAKVVFAGGDELLLSAAKLSEVHQYASKEAENVRLSQLKSKQWHKTLARARSSAKKLADEYLHMYYRRLHAKGYAFGPDSAYQKEFELSFPYEETPDQQKAIWDVKQDMEKPIPMDRLICGDVGFGKTEVAVRAMFKCVEANKQVLMLVPTTVLAYMHYTNFAARFQDYGVSVELLCSFVPPKRQKKIAQDFSKGLIDIVVGTHRLLSADVVPKDLGLLVVDEEQRFGVAHKDKLKLLKENVDTLTLSATPIPRTLNMALMGMRDVSNIKTPPQGRREVITYVMASTTAGIKNALVKELSRQGQVFYVYNRVSDMERKREVLQNLVPQARIAIAHGQMQKSLLERVMIDFFAGNYDILLCSTIIENGVDMPNVNTIIIEDAQNFGLSQLHQLRGRVGRAKRVGYAYMLFDGQTQLSEVQIKRLKAIREFARLGSGFKIADMDLQLRGAGELLGSNQSGHFSDVGYDLYMKLLQEAIGEGKAFEEDKQEHTSPKVNTSVDLDLAALIDRAYVPNENERIVLYKKIALIDDENDLQAVREEMLDRYGQLPYGVKNLLRLALLRANLSLSSVLRLRQKADTLELTPADGFSPAPQVLKALYRLHHYKHIENAAVHKFIFALEKDEDVLAKSESIAQILLSRENDCII